MHRLRHPTNELLKKDVNKAWSRKLQQAFEEVKTMLSSDLPVTHFNPVLKIVVAAKAVISHIFPENAAKAIYHAETSLTAAERNYGQSGMALAIIVALRKFH
uniref:Uncharacterized protein K02A2.6 n=1 Tax=Schistocephalus solidus TaxID=70667 RepID=A0A0X3PEP2_SCHSO